MKTPAMPMLGATERNTFMGVREATLAETHDCDIAIFGAPCATPYAGASEYSAANLRAPQAIRDGIRMWASALDRYDWDLGERPFLGRQDRVLDLGDLDTSLDTADANRALIGSTVNTAVANGAIPFVLGGDDSVPIPVIEALEAKRSVHILQIDAHIDWRDDVEGEKYGLSSVMRRASELPWVKGIVQVGARGLSSAGYKEIQTARNWGAEIYTAQHVFDHGIADIVGRIPKGAQVHINLDLDGLDPSIMPAVFVPAPGGLLYWQVAKLLIAVAERAKICSFAMVEFAPDKDRDGTAALTAARLMSLTAGAILRSKYVKKEKWWMMPSQVHLHYSRA
ncbi:arginase family protein [Rhizobium ruizarguesonis]|uniref:arginase family protein n=1 Tax=Rhizobium TaxID=379 RepID=UPI001FEF023A|nr:arginase family protein [Rhizobium ruizarguesonis]